MGLQSEGINGGFSGRVGTVVGYRRLGTWCVRAYVPSVCDARSERQLGQRGRFVAMVRFASQLREVLHAGMGFCSHEAHLTEGNYFVKLNKGCFALEGEALSIDYPQLRVSDGEVAEVGFGEVACRNEGMRWLLAATFVRNPLRLTVDGGDRVYLAAICAERSEALLSVPAYRRQEAVAITLPQEWQGCTVHLYGFVQSAHGEASPTTYLGRFQLTEPSADVEVGPDYQSESGTPTNEDAPQQSLSEPMASTDGLANLGGKVGQLVVPHADVVAEVEVGGSVEGQEVDVGVGDVNADHSHSDLDAGTDFFQSDGYLLGKELELGVEDVVEVEEVVDLGFGDAEHMASDDGVDVEECETVVGFGHTVAGDFARHNFAEDTAHEDRFNGG